MNQDMINALKELERDKGIPFTTILNGLAEAMASAYKSWWKQQHPELDEESFGVRATMDPESGDLRVWLQDLDEEGAVTSEKEVEVTDDFKGRIGAQTAKQVIYQKLRDAERELTYEEFAGARGTSSPGSSSRTRTGTHCSTWGRSRRCCRRPSRSPPSHTATASA